MVDVNLVWQTEGRLSVVVHGHHAPTNLEWERYLNHTRQNVSIPDLVVLVLTLGGSPDGKQRQGMADVARQDYPHPPPVAMLTGSVIVRSVMKLSTMFNPYIRCFSPDHLALAYAYLDLSSSEQERAKRTLDALTTQVV